MTPQKYLNVDILPVYVLNVHDIKNIFGSNDILAIQDILSLWWLLYKFLSLGILYVNNVLDVPDIPDIQVAHYILDILHYTTSTMTLHLLGANEVSLFRFQSRCHFAPYDPRMEVICEILWEECNHPCEGECLFLHSATIRELRQQGLHNPNICIAFESK